MDLGLSGRTALITGGSKASAFCCRPAYLEEGARVVLVARDAGGWPRRRYHSVVPMLSPIAADLSQGGRREALAARFPDIDI